MEGDLTNELDATLLIDFDFDDEVHDVLENALFQANPSDQQNVTAHNLSEVQRDVLDHVETGSASRNNLPRSSSGEVTSTENLNPTMENIASHIAPPRSINFDSTIGVTQAYNPTTEVMNRDPQPVITNTSITESTNQPPISNGPIHFPPSSVASNVSSHFSPPSATSNIPFSGAGQPYFSPAVNGIRGNDEVLLPQLNTRSTNGLQNEILYSGPMSTPANLSNPLLADQQLPQNVGNSYFGYNSNQQALPYLTSYPQINSMGSGITNGGSQINYQQPPACPFNNQNFPCNTPFPPSRPQINQLLVPNQQCSSFMLPSPSVPLRPQHVANQQYQVNQVQGNVYNPQHQCFIMPENSAFIRPPLYHPGVSPNNPVMPGDGPMLVPRGQELPNYGPVNQVFPTMPNVMKPQLNSSLLLDPSMAAGSYSNPGSSQLNSNLNSAAQQLAIGGQQHGVCRCHYEVGESSAPKRARMDSIGLERGSQLLVSNNGRDNHVNYSRPVKNSLYDPLYESIGLPTDPHLRCFSRRN